MDDPEHLFNIYSDIVLSLPIIQSECVEYLNIHSTHYTASRFIIYHHGGQNKNRLWDLWDLSVYSFLCFSRRQKKSDGGEDQSVQLTPPPMRCNYIIS